MARTLPRYARFYQNGYDLCAHTRSIGPAAWDADFTNERGLCWDIHGGLLGDERITQGQVNTIFNWNATDAPETPHDWIKGWDGDPVHIMAPIGLGAAPAVGDPTWMVVIQQRTSTVLPNDSGMLTTTIDYEPLTAALPYPLPWGKLIHAKGAETAVNAAAGYDDTASTSLGGWMMAQIFEVVGAGNVTVKLQDAAVNNDGGFADVASLSTGLIADTDVPYSGVFSLGAGATIRRYLRWQIVLGAGITSVTFALSLVRGR